MNPDATSTPTPVTPEPAATPVDATSPIFDTVAPTVEPIITPSVDTAPVSMPTMDTSVTPEPSPVAEPVTTEPAPGTIGGAPFTPGPETAAPETPAAPMPTVGGGKKSNTTTIILVIVAVIALVGVGAAILLSRILE